VLNAAWLTSALIAITPLAWLRHLALDGDLAKAGPKPGGAGGSGAPSRQQESATVTSPG
jgi:hypothetical protein